MSQQLVTDVVWLPSDLQIVQLNVVGYVVQNTLCGGSSGFCCCSEGVTCTTCYLSHLIVQQRPFKFAQLGGVVTLLCCSV